MSKKEENSELKKLADSLSKKIEVEKLRSDIIAKKLFEKVKPYSSTPPKEFAAKDPKLKTINEEVCLVISDMHIGYEFDLEETGGITEYSYAVFKKRLNTLKKKVVENLSVHTPHYKKKKLNIFLLGDVVAGSEIGGEWAGAYLAMTVSDQAMKGADDIAEFIYYFKGMFDSIEVHCVKGNHGRYDKTKSEKDYCNWDNLCYEFIKLRLSSSSEIKVNTTKSFFMTTDVNGFKFLLHHGDKISGSNALGKLEDAQLKYSAIKREFYDYIVCGHYHVSQDTSTILGRAIINGSFMGGDMYSIQSLQQSRTPYQKMFAVKSKEGISWSYDIPLC